MSTITRYPGNIQECCPYFSCTVMLPRLHSFGGKTKLIGSYTEDYLAFRKQDFLITFAQSADPIFPRKIPLYIKMMLQD